MLPNPRLFLWMAITFIWGGFARLALEAVSISIFFSVIHNSASKFSCHIWRSASCNSSCPPNSLACGLFALFLLISSLISFSYWLITREIFPICNTHVMYFSSAFFFPLANRSRNFNSSVVCQSSPFSGTQAKTWHKLSWITIDCLVIYHLNLHEIFFFLSAPRSPKRSNFNFSILLSISACNLSLFP